LKNGQQRLPFNFLKIIFFSNNLFIFTNYSLIQHIEMYHSYFARTLYTVLLVSTVNQLFGQSNFQSGYVVNIEGDTLRGKIDYRNWEKNPKKITFQYGDSSGPNEFAPADLISFAVMDEIYVSALVETEVSSSNTNQLDNTARLETIQEQVFLQTLIKGEKSLYLNVNSFSKENFYIKDGDRFLLLTYKKYNAEKLEGGYTRSYVAENKMYQGQLSVYLQDCPSMKKATQSVLYKKESLKRLFESYYDCIGEPLEFSKRDEKTFVKWGVLAGVSATSLRFDSEFHPNLTNPDYGTSINPTFGGSMDIIFARNLNKWAMVNELVYASYQHSGESVNQKNNNLTEYSSTTFAYHQIKMNNMIRYSSLIGNTEWFTNLGLATGLAISHTNEENLRTVFFETEKFETREAVEGGRIFEVGFLLGAGIRIKKISTEIRYENGNGMSNFPSLASTTHKFIFQLGYRF
jgi:hypothetical protein